MGEEELSDLDKTYLAFGVAFEDEFLRQGEFENRTIEQTLEIGWRMLSHLPQEELYRVRREDIQRYYISEDER